VSGGLLDGGGARELRRGRLAGRVVLALAALALAWSLPRKAAGLAAVDAAQPLAILYGCAIGLALVSWVAALVGLYVSSFRSVGAVS
jgi:hypothetical protein